MSRFLLLLLLLCFSPSLQQEEGESDLSLGESEQSQGLEALEDTHSDSEEAGEEVGEEDVDGDSSEEEKQADGNAGDDVEDSNDDEDDNEGEDEEDEEEETFPEEEGDPPEAEPAAPSSMRNLSQFPVCVTDTDCEAVSESEARDYKCFQYMCYPWAARGESKGPFRTCKRR